MTKVVFASFLFFSASLGAQERGIKLWVSGADTYPTTLAYDVIDPSGTRIIADFAPLKDANTPVIIPVELKDMFGVVIYEDANENAELDMGIFGQPTERYGYSNGAWKFLGRPEHEETLVVRKGNWTELRITLKSVMDY
tara:strand:+ start:3081 stop:3497 length:417 start_codon:yes stop_codon:yes gene_type:complete